MGKKRCSKCRELKEESDFYRDKRKKDELQSQCKDCRKEYRKQNKEQIAKQNKKYYNKKKKQIAKWAQGYYKENKEQRGEYQRDYRKTANGKLANKRGDHNRRALIDNTEATLTAEQWNTILKQQKNRCAKCDKRFTKKNPPTADHIVPLSKGGGLIFGNVQALCGSCNSSKNCRLDSQWIQSWCVNVQAKKPP